MDRRVHAIVYGQNLISSNRIYTRIMHLNNNRICVVRDICVQTYVFLISYSFFLSFFFPVLLSIRNETMADTLKYEVFYYLIL